MTAAPAEILREARKTTAAIAEVARVSAQEWSRDRMEEEADAEAELFKALCDLGRAVAEYGRAQS